MYSSGNLHRTATLNFRVDHYIWVDRYFWVGRYFWVDRYFRVGRYFWVDRYFRVGGVTFGWAVTFGIQWESEKLKLLSWSRYFLGVFTVRILCIWTAEKDTYDKWSHYWSSQLYKTQLTSFEIRAWKKSKPERDQLPVFCSKVNVVTSLQNLVASRISKFLWSWFCFVSGFMCPINVSICGV